MTYTAVHFRQYCALGLDARELMPTLMSVLHGIIPSHFNVFWWADKNNEIKEFLTENPEAIKASRRYMTEFANKRELKSIPISFRQHMSDRSIRNAANLGGALYKSDFYRELLQPIGIRTLMRGSVPGGVHGGGSIMLTRAPGEKMFNTAEERRLQSLLPHLAHALAAPRSEAPLDYVDCDENIGLLLVNRRGQIEYSNAQGRAFMGLLEFAEQTRGETPLAACIAQAAKMIDAIKRGQDVAPPSFTVRSAWGGFRFRCYDMSSRTDANSLMCVWITRQMPKAIRHLATIQSFGLSPRLTEYCHAISSGLSHADAARSLNITQNTGKGYFDLIREKLNISSREELLKRIREADKA